MSYFHLGYGKGLRMVAEGGVILVVMGQGSALVPSKRFRDSFQVGFAEAGD